MHIISERDVSLTVQEVKYCRSGCRVCREFLSRRESEQRDIHMFVLLEHSAKNPLSWYIHVCQQVGNEPVIHGYDVPFLFRELCSSSADFLQLLWSSTILRNRTCPHCLVSPYGSFLQRTRIGQPDSEVPTGWVARRKAVGKGLAHRPLFSLSLSAKAVSYTHLRAHETDSYLVCRLLLE